MRKKSIENDHCRIVVDADNMTKEEWLELRRCDIGGSDAGAIMGLNKYKGPLNVYAEKKALTNGVDETDAIRHGVMMEPVLRKVFSSYYWENSVMKMTTYKSPYVYQSTRHPFMIANLDGLVQNKDYRLGGLEIKSVGAYAAKDWADENVPDSYFAQVQHYIAVTGLDYFIIFALIGQKLIHRIVVRNNDFIELMIEKERNFWDEYVFKNVMPQPIGIDAEDDILDQLCGNTDAIIDAPEVEQDIKCYLMVSKSIKTLEEKKKQIQNSIKARMGEANKLIAGEHSVKWSKFPTKRFNSTLLKEEKPDVYEAYLQETESGRLTIK